MIRVMYISFKIPYVYDYTCITKLCRQQAIVIQHHENIKVHKLDKAKPEREKKKLNLAVVGHMTIEVIKLVLQPELPLTGHNLLKGA
jgi:hypothetical protein